MAKTTTRTDRALKPRFDVTAIAAIPAGVGLILFGQAIEGGAVGSLMQVAAALIVFGGTSGAVLLSFSTAQVMESVRAVRTVFVEPLEPAAHVIKRIMAYAAKARRTGVMTIEEDVNDEPDPFLRRGLSMAVDGSSQSQIRAALEFEIDSISERDGVPPRVFEAAGGYSPTIGIIGAVLGLIHVMENLSDPSKLGPGIATAFVATVYGVGLANLILLPIAGKMRERARAGARRREMLLDAVVAIQEGLNPRLLEQRLLTFAPDGAPQPSKKGAPLGLPSQERS
jgi:chemotaxis protein MotA